MVLRHWWRQSRWIYFSVSITVISPVTHSCQMHLVLSGPQPYCPPCPHRLRHKWGLFQFLEGCPAPNPSVWHPLQGQNPCMPTDIFLSSFPFTLGKEKETKHKNFWIFSHLSLWQHQYRPHNHFYCLASYPLWNVGVFCLFFSGFTDREKQSGL